MRRGKASWLAMGLAVAMPVAHAQETLPNEPVKQLDLKRYLGEWHEIAHLPMFFQRQCVDSITATYTAMPDGQVHVHNACRTQEGGHDAADGVARTTEKAGALQVRFAPAWLSWLPWVWADYWVLDVDPDYRWAVVGSPSRRYLWVLSRDAEMQRAQFEALRHRASLRGYPVERLVMSAPLN
ncbi:lipocalin family protein [Dyella sp. C11]|uniref:lipocalin family protein n=1 Tax=Dyella sp. C11 TaxID=2126991 RepID=UPI000D64431D|nr:lipocalin family protein [Dyella sp. C11]